MNSNETSELATLADVESALARAETVEEVHDLAARAEAMRRYLRRSTRELGKQNECARFRLRALRKLGALLAASPKNAGTRYATRRLHDVTAVPRTLAEQGISKRDSAKWQRLAAIPAGLFEETCKKIIAGGGVLTESSFTSLISRLRDGPAPWTTSQAHRALRTALDGIFARWPKGEEARDLLAAELKARAKHVEGWKGNNDDEN